MEQMDQQIGAGLQLCEYRNWGFVTWVSGYTETKQVVSFGGKAGIKPYLDGKVGLKPVFDGDSGSR